MIPKLREQFNAQFSEARYIAFLDELNSILKYPTDFRVCETPLFLSDEFNSELLKACDEIIAQLITKEFKEKSIEAIPKHLNVPNDTDHPIFLSLDFAITKNGNDFFPKLIELQGFPTLYGYQYFLNRVVRKYFDIPDEFTCYYSGYDEDEYVDLLERIILATEDPEQVVLLEIEPHKQKTRIDFAAMEKLIGIPEVCISDLIKKDKKLFYKKDGREIEIKRIYNRVIFDELERKQIESSFSFFDEVDVQWVGHPNWFFRISKYSLPQLKGKYVPECYYLDDIKNYPEDLSQFVLKPLFSFAGLGVDVDVTKEKLDKITDRKNYILQQKVEYAPVIKTPDDYSKVEIRMMYLWEENSPKPELVLNLIRTSKGKMMGVDFNKNKTWVGSSLAFHQ
ncbi:Hypothetical protein IALB_1284 [Ignavibacterium album JCM 16511]|uniref:Uncharacterized protein n=1 Tax=Ignavibacterium album (strain DSM 19864 / JCM 16511 / NBRC 101810 / Mat9-16) TaxID=945713 RepID=I0AJ37_IGNAJ|nr:hypothetical protein [Ignavibacterium album]AFH48994.1 Hypothetical protein IALB_1284 [Ignavibacterium album JCM 16511]